MNYRKLTTYICVSIILLISIYDGVIVALSGNIDSSVSIWFASYSAYCVPVFTCAFLLGHFFGVVANKLAKTPAKMKRYKLYITTSLIIATCYDIVMAHIHTGHMISTLPYLSYLNGWNTTLMVGGIFAGKNLGTMDATKPAGY